jgi:hypothetical protein
MNQFLLCRDRTTAPHAPLTQRTELLFSTQWVAGSNPARGASKGESMDDLLVRINMNGLVYFVPLGTVSKCVRSDIAMKMSAELIINPETNEIVKSRYSL